MQVQKLREGLWRWTAPHPAWTPEADRPDGWAQDVGSVYYETQAGVVLIDPLVPADAGDATRFWAALDRDVARVGGTVTVLVGCADHGRSADAVRERYAAAGRQVAVAGDAVLPAAVSCRLTATLPGFPMPSGVAAYPIDGLVPGETAYFLSEPRALVFADAVVGAGGGRVRLAPPSWAPKDEAGRARYARAFRASVARLCDLRPDLLLTSHGEPVVDHGEAALREAVTGAAWGDRPPP